ncbi:MAG: biopolymer transporter ExbD [Holosporales bacterium]|nr:biopolymer transporter ExbD [Holosporales bacterium]
MLRNYGTRHKSRAVISDINVTPMIDVMLVLLVIFMVTTPLLTIGVKVDLPKAEASAILDQEEPLVISIKNDKTIWISDVCVDRETFVSKLLAITNNNTAVRLYLYADRDLRYEDVMQAMSALNSVGFKKIALISDTPGKGKK